MRKIKCRINSKKVGWLWSFFHKNTLLRVKALFSEPLSWYMEGLAPQFSLSVSTVLFHAEDYEKEKKKKLFTSQHLRRQQTWPGLSPNISGQARPVQASPRHLNRESQSGFQKGKLGNAIARPNKHCSSTAPTITLPC